MSKSNSIPQISTFPEYQAAVANKGRLQNELAAIEKRIRETISEIKPDASDDLSDRARARLEGHKPPRSEQAAAEYERATADRRELLLAIDLAGKSIEKVRGELSQKVCAENKSRYREVGRRIARAIAELQAAADEEFALRSDIEAAGYRFVDMPNFAIGWARSEENATGGRIKSFMDGARAESLI